MLEKTHWLPAQKDQFSKHKKNAENLLILYGSLSLIKSKNLSKVQT